jgi:hypothetical protein
MIRLHRLFPLALLAMRNEHSRPDVNRAFRDAAPSASGTR